MSKEQFNWEQFQPADQPQAPAEEKPFSWDQFQLVGSIDPNTGEERPEYANGISPERAINKSPLSINDRLQLAFGNKKGRIDFLKQRYEDVVETEDGDLRIKKDGLWHVLDAKGLEAKDPWELSKGIAKAAAVGAFNFAVKGNPVGMTANALSGGRLNKAVDEASSVALKGDEVASELAKDAADIVPEATAIGASIAAGVATGGASLAAQAAAAGGAALGAGAYRTSLGRLVGTYDADPETQFKELAMETMLAFAGTGIALGVKPTAQWMAKQIPGLSKLANANKVVGDVWGKWAVGSDDAIDVMRTMPKDLSARMSALAAQGDDMMLETARNSSIEQIKQISALSDDVIGQVYKKQADQLVRSAPETFQAPLKDVVRDVYEQSIASGLGTIKVAGKELSQSEALEYLAKNGVDDAATFSVKSLKEFEKGLNAGLNSELMGLSLDDSVYNSVAKAIERIDGLAKQPALSGKEGADQLLRFQQLTNKLTRDLTTVAQRKGVNSAAAFSAKLNDTLKKRYTDIFSKMTPNSDIGGKLYTSLNARYSQALNTFDRLSELTDTSANTMVKRLTGDFGRGSERQMLTELVNLADEFKLPAADKIKGALKEIRLNEAAALWSPMVNKKLTGQVVGPGLVAGGIANGTVGLNAETAVAATLFSPRLNYYAWQAKDTVATTLKKYGPQRAAEAFSRPEVVLPLTQSIIEATRTERDTSAQLLGGQGE